MKEIIRSVFFFLIVFFSINAQENSEIPSLKGKYALQFRITENFTLSSFQGAIFSGKYCFTDYSSIRLGVSVSSSTFDDEASQNSLNSQNNVSIITDSNGEETAYNYGFSLQYIYNLKATEDILFFTGFGPFFNLRNSEKEIINSRTPTAYTNNSNSSRTQKTTSIGVEALCGIEWFVKSNISISAEYGIGFSYNHTKSDETRFENDTNSSVTLSSNSTRNSYLVNASNINFGVSFYF